MRGFTLLETLCALAVFGIFLSGLLYAEQSYHRGVGSEDEALRMQQKQAAVGLLRAEVGMAGYGHPGDDVAVSSERTTDRLTLVYLEDRVAGAPTLRTVTFDAGLDANGAASLYRKEGSGYRQPAVLGVREIRVVSWIDSSGVQTTMPDGDVAAVVVELAFAWEERMILTIGFLNSVSYGPVGSA